MRAGRDAAGAFAAGAFAALARSLAFSSWASKDTLSWAPYACATRARERSDGRYRGSSIRRSCVCEVPSFFAAARSESPAS